MKRIIICADGTWNKPEVNIATDFPTNVLKITRLLKTENTDIPQQIFYDPGIGSNSSLMTLKLYKGITGSSLQNHVINCYRYLVHNYCLGDEIFLFGFSRGAYTIRSLCGLINNCGILRHEYANRINETFLNYKNPHPSFQPNSDIMKDYKKNYTHNCCKIKFVGVWDTVGALGIPFKSSESFYDTKMGSNIVVARHALAIDEMRKKFKPSLWKNINNDNQNLIQMWFVGSHSDVGGGYTPDNKSALLSNVSLLWMIQEAEKSGLELEEYSTLLDEKHIFGDIHNSRNHFYIFRPKYLRIITGPNEIIHSSVYQRIEKLNYISKNLNKYLKTKENPV